ncbi:hypothetical protein V1505DRAFT_382142 [Lipomyces doorenjongii]
MSKLTSHGYIAIVELIIYTIALVTSTVSCLRYGFKRQAGWIYLSIFCILRLLASALVIVVEKSSEPSTGMVVTARLVNNKPIAILYRNSMR